MNKLILASNICSLRIEKKWTQEDLAKFTNVSRQAVSKWENGVSIPDLEILLDLSKLFSISINDLVEKPTRFGITEFEEVISIDKIRLSTVLKNFTTEDLIIAVKGASPSINTVFSEIFPEIDFEDEKNKIGPVRVSEVEKTHKRIIEMINMILLKRHKKTSLNSKLTKLTFVTEPCGESSKFRANRLRSAEPANFVSSWCVI